MSAAIPDRQFPNHVQPFRVENGWIRGRLIRLGSAFEQTAVHNKYPKPVGRILGETLALAAALSTALKFEGNFKLQAQGDGPVSLLVVDITSDGGLRGYARFDAEAFDGDNLQGQDPFTADSDLVPRLLGAGHLAFTVDQNLEGDRYQGVTALAGGSLADCAHTYFRDSEQLETAIKLTAHYGGDGVAPRAAALMIQRMPGDKPPEMPDEEAEEAWRNAVILMSSVTSQELLDAELPTQDILYRLYHADGIRVYDKLPLRFQCRCSRDRATDMLINFGGDDFNDMKTENGMIVVSCEFCRTDYEFTEQELIDLKSAESQESPTT
ncbi:MAG: Hsp33 family molecular chaperone HslO [Proteobacteria bacterium]|nr:Hsp33 family molecular chaperone HslO [Pseudomonadota bacterium]